MKKIVLFGWLFWSFGLESAILAHIFADIIRHSLIPFVSLQESETARFLAMGGVVVMLLGALLWAFRLLIVKRRAHYPNMIR